MGGVWIVAAVTEELGPLAGRALGVGPVRAAAAMAQALATGPRPAGVLLVGTAGSYRADLAPGTVVVGDRLGFADGGAASGLGYVPLPPVPLRASARWVAAAEAAGARSSSVLTLAAITTDEALAARLGVDWEVEHMEAYGAALGCAEAGVPFVPVLGITNAVGPGAHEAWRAWRGRAEAAARDVAVRVAEAMGHGVR